jgi:hypothetical protein
MPKKQQSSKFANSKPEINNEEKFQEFIEQGIRIEHLAQLGLKKEIALHKEAKNPIFYSRDGMLIMELADNRCFEYRKLPDGTRKIIREVPH